MPASGLGIFDTAPDRREIRLGLIMVALLFAAFLVILPIRDVRLPEVSAFVPTIDSIMFIGDLIAATLLYGQGSLFQSRALIVLATGYLISAQLLVAHALTFPGAFSPNGLLHAGINTTAWIATVQRMAFPIAIIFYVRLRRMEAPPRIDHDRSLVPIAAWVVGAFAIAGAVTLLATLGHGLLPAFYANRADLVYSNAVAYQFVIFTLLLIAGGMLLRDRRSVLDLWLLVALSGWLIQSALIITLHARFTAGFYYLYGLLLVSHLIVLIALIAEFQRLYARLALSMAAQNMERDARLMSMDAVAAAIAHEVGQPIAAISINASLGLKSLTRRSIPNVEGGVEALRAISASAERSFEIIKSIRAIFAKDPHWAIQFSLNDMIRETAALLDRELAAAKISLKLSLDETIPLIAANRVQLQQVLVNLLKNAIEASVAAHGKHRTVAVKSRFEDERMLIEVTDDGIGIAASEVLHIFDPFHTTKTDGTGIGLCLCRTIVEDHGGRIWASNAQKRGATIHVALPRHLFVGNVQLRQGHLAAGKLH